MQPIVSVTLDDDLRTATERMIGNGLRELPIVDEANKVVGLLDETDIANMYLRAAVRAESSGADSVRG